jgi:hypothetical protein
MSGAGVPERWATGVALLVAPVAALAVLTDHALLTASLVSTCAIAVHRPHAFDAAWVRIVRSYAATIALTVVLAVAGAAVGLPPTGWALAAIAVAVLSYPGRVHAPAAGMPLVVVDAHGLPAAVCSLAAAGGGIAFVLGGLRALWSRGRRTAAGVRECEPGRRVEGPVEHADQ